MTDHMYYFDHHVYKSGLVPGTKLNRLQKACETTLHHTIPSYNEPEDRSLLKILWEKEKMLLSVCLLLIPKKISNFHSYLFCRLQMRSKWTRQKFSGLVKNVWLPNKSI